MALTATMMKGGAKALTKLGKKTAKSQLKGFLDKAKQFPVTKIGEKLKNEQEVSKELHHDVLATLERMKAKDDGLGKKLEEAYGYAVFPAVGRAGLVLGVSYGKGEVFKHGKLAGYSGLVQVTIGVQVGGQTFSELVLFQDEDAFKRFKGGPLGFAANAAAVFVKAGAAASNRYKNGMQVFVHSQGGMMLQVDLGLQKLVFRQAALTRGKRADEDTSQDEPGQQEEEHAQEGAAG